MISNHHPPKSKRSNNGAPDSNASIESVSNKGPLLTSTLAMFGPNSWIDLVRRYPDLYGNRTINTQQSDSICLDLAPLTRILNRWTTVNSAFAIKSSAFVEFTKCITIESLSTKEASERYTYEIAAKWLSNFRARSRPGEGLKEAESTHDILSNAFTASAYLANMAWISHKDSFNCSLSVMYDMGADSKKPTISLAGIIIMSILIGLDLLGLLATALYASWFLRWTGPLNAFSMMRLGSSIGDRIPLKTSADDDEVRVLDELPGWMGVEGDKSSGLVMLGGTAPLRTKWRYEAYVDKEK